MSQIISNKEIYTTREGVKCFVKIAIDDFNESKQEKGFNAIVTDTAVIYEDEQDLDDPNVVTKVLKEITVLSRRAVKYPYNQIDALFNAIGDPIQATESFSGQLNLLQSRALLIITKQDPVYGSQSQDWEIMTDL